MCLTWVYWHKAKAMKENTNYMDCGIKVLNGFAAFLGYVLVKRRVLPSLDLDDIDSVREMLRVFRPEKVEYAYFDAIIQNYRGYVAQSIQTFRHLLEARPNYPTAKAFLAHALFVQRDAAWETLAAEVIESSDSTQEEITLMHVLHKQNDMQKGLISQEEFAKYISEISDNNNAMSNQNTQPVLSKSTEQSVPNYAVRM